jgi:hypothetical protein
MSRILHAQSSSYDAAGNVCYQSFEDNTLFGQGGRVLKNVALFKAFTLQSGQGNWRLIILGLLVLAITPMLLISVPIFMIFGQILLGVGLSIVNWMIVNYPPEQSKVCCCF